MPVPRMKEEITLPAVMENVLPALQFLRENLLSCGCSSRILHQLAVVSDEILSNIVRYAYPAGNGTMTFRFETEPAPDAEHPASVCLTFVDQGLPYDPLKAPVPDTTLSAAKRKPGGLGIHIAKHMMDDACYEYKDGRNILRLRKDLT